MVCPLVFLMTKLSKIAFINLGPRNVILLANNSFSPTHEHDSRMFLWVAEYLLS